METRASRGGVEAHQTHVAQPGAPVARFGVTGWRRPRLWEAQPGGKTALQGREKMPSSLPFLAPQAAAQRSEALKN
jgi:hypothetical protein